MTTSARLKGLESQVNLQYGRLVEEILEKLGLDGEETRGSRIGDATTRGVSGGQRKRVSVAQELVGDDTDVLLLDEPTSGLDPRNEANVVHMLREITDSGKQVVTAPGAAIPAIRGEGVGDHPRSSRGRFFTISRRLR